jgi:DNA-binding HxlR family transcriptional regulator
MKCVDTIARIRREFFVQGKTILIRLNNPDQLRLIRPAPQRPEPEPIDTLEAVGAVRLMAFPAARWKAHHGDRCACGLYSWRNRPYVCCMSIEPQQLPADCRRAGDILARLGDKWTILLLMVLGDRRMRFTELHRTINGISQRMLTVTLRNLEHDGILIRTVYPTIPPRVEYELSDRGRSLKVALAPIGNWVMENQTDIEEARERLREQSPDDSAVVDD